MKPDHHSPIYPSLLLQQFRRIEPTTFQRTPANRTRGEAVLSMNCSANNYQKKTYFEKTLVQTAEEEEANTTMADPVIGATVQVLLEKLISLTIKELNSSRDFNKDLEMLTQNVSLIQAFIHDVETPQVYKQRSFNNGLTA
ncbi:hypothetical protein H5410_053295 [Solanum commersonii]|uniref:Disease resistance N-terminal domain-containing protein n=1 Tax=Solanum commersonii TaxID=4109 RepID=A0A9J5X5W5_SOLCO|nr:hypothetical protein H5410_053295 [Solanum commersonii]